MSQEYLSNSLYLLHLSPLKVFLAIVCCFVLDAEWKKYQQFLLGENNFLRYVEE